MKSKLILVGVVSALALTGVWFFALWAPQGASLKNAKVEQQAAETRAAQLRARLTHLKQLEANADVLERDRVRLATAVPDTDQLDKFILGVNERANASGVSFVSVSPTKPTPVAPIPVAAPATAGATEGATTPAVAAPAAVGPTPIGLQLQVTGDYFAIMRFLESLRDGERLVTVESLNLSKGTEGSVTTAAITGKMFVNPQPAPGIAATAPAPANQTARA